MNNTKNESIQSFDDFGLLPAVLTGIQKSGYKEPSPIQSATIPYLLEGKDVLAQAQTGTGKTAAFALPILSKIDQENRSPQALVLAPTRELAQQVADAFKTYATDLKGIKILPLCGGQDYRHQLKELDYGMHIIVGTPGRIMDHIRRGSLDVSGISHLVLDEGDEMLRMGFIDDITWILEQTPEEKQTALFSATMPPAIRKIAHRHLNNPEVVHIEAKTTTADSIEQVAMVLHHQGEKNQALMHILETDNHEGMIVFVRTKSETEVISEMLCDAGYKSVALNGDMPQNKRDRTIKAIREKKAHILVATDVAARGIDIQHLSHVINYDIPFDTESYVHRIGRTGRAGKGGKAILFVNPRERHHLRNIEQETRQRVTIVNPPSAKEVNVLRVQNFKKRIDTTLEKKDLAFFTQLITDYQAEKNADPIQLAAALALMAQGDQPLLIKETEKKPYTSKKRDFDDRGPRRFDNKGPRRSYGKNSSSDERKGSEGSYRGRSSGSENGGGGYRGRSSASENGSGGGYRGRSSASENGSGGGYRGRSSGSENGSGGGYRGRSSGSENGGGGYRGRSSGSENGGGGYRGRSSASENGSGGGYRGRSSASENGSGGGYRGRSSSGSAAPRGDRRSH